MGNPDHPNKKITNQKTLNHAPGKKSGGDFNDPKPDKTELISDSTDFSDLHKLISQGIVLQNTLGIVTYANPAAGQILGLSPDEIVGHPLVHPRWKLIREDGSELLKTQYPFMVALRSGKPVKDVTLGVIDLHQEKCKWVLVNTVPEFLPDQNKPYQVITTFTDVSYIKSIVDTFGKHETLLNLAMVASDLGIWKLTFDNPQFFMDETTRRHFGFNTSLTSVGDVFDRLHPEDQERVRLETRKFLGQNQTDSTKSDFRVILPDGTIKWLAINVVIKFVETGSGLIPFTAVGTAQDITNRKQAEEALQQKSRALFVLSKCNQALVKISTEIELLQEICRICVADGHYLLAWVGFITADNEKSLQLVAQCGFEEGYLASMQKVWEQAGQYGIPTAAAIRTNKVSIARNIQNNPDCISIRDEARKYGYGSAIALPINVGWNLIGVFTLYSIDIDDFKTDEVNLLLELTNNMAFGIEALKNRENQIRLEKELRISEGRYELAQKSAHIGSWEWDIRTNKMFWSDEMYFLFEKNPEDFTPTYSAMVACMVPEDRLLTAQAINDSSQSGNPFDVEFKIQDLENNTKWINSKGIVFQDKTGQPILASGTMQDITHRKQVEDDLLQANQKYHLISEYSNDVIWVMDVETEKFSLVISPSVKKLRGYTVEEMMQQTMADVLTPESYEKIINIMSNSIPDYSEGKPSTSFVLELDQIRKDKSVVTTEVTSSQVYDDQGNLQIIGISRDITQRKQAEAVLKEERNLFQVLMNNIPDAIYFKNTKSRFIRINKAEADFFGLRDPSQAVGKTDFDFFTEEHAQPAYENEQGIIKSGQPLIDFEEKETYSDGHTRWISTSKLPYRNSLGEIIGTFGISYEITKRKEMELSLQQRVLEMETVYQLQNRIRSADTVQGLLKTLLDETLKVINSKDGAIFLFEPSTNKLMLHAANGWFEQLAGLILEPDEGINGHVFSSNQAYFTEEMHNDQFLAQRVKNLIPSDQYGGFFPIQSGEGIIGVIDVYIPSPRTFSENEKRLLAVISQMAGNAIHRSRLNEKLKTSNENLQEEIYQRTNYQELLAAEKELLSTTLMSIGEGVIITDKLGTVILFNHSAGSLTGFSVIEAVDYPINNVFKIIDPITQEVVADLFSDRNMFGYLQGTDPNHKAPLLIRKSGERILIEGNISVLTDLNGEMMGHVLVFQNITEKQKAEAQTALSQKMEAIGQLAAGIAHEINTPIQYVGDNLQFLQKTVTKFNEFLDAYKEVSIEPGEILIKQEIERLNEVMKQTKVQHFLTESPNAVQEALDGVERVRKIVLAMREFSHPSEKEKKLADINHSIETTITISHNEWKYFADMVTELDPDLPLITCQIDEINQVILNMIINAVQAIQEKNPEGSEQKGKITIKTSRGRNKILILIQDTGKGMPEAIQQRIFDPFFTTKEIGRGTGQGLTLAHQIIVQKHQGAINVESIEGEGTTFTIELPISTKEKSM